MKQIEKEMNQAINAKRNFAKSNTRVINKKNGVFVILYSTIIFACVNGVNYYSNGGYNTVTTASRLRALGADYSTAAKADRSFLTPQKQMLTLFKNTK